jgi:urease accessory protein
MVSAPELIPPAGAASIRAAASVYAAAAGGRTRLTTLRSDGPLQLRPTPGAVYLAAGAGGPLRGDAWDLDIDVGPGADLTIRSTAATVALAGRGDGWSTFRVRASVADGARLRWLPEPTVAADGACHRSIAEIALAPGARLTWREESVLGREGELGGRLVVCTYAHRGEQPLLRSELALSGQSDPVVRGGHRAMGSMLVVCPAADEDPRSTPSAEDAGALIARPDLLVAPIARGAVLVTALSYDALGLRALLDEGGAAAGDVDPSPARGEGGPGEEPG